MKAARIEMSPSLPLRLMRHSLGPAPNQNRKLLARRRGQVTASWERPTRPASEASGSGIDEIRESPAC